MSASNRDQVFIVGGGTMCVGPQVFRIVVQHAALSAITGASAQAEPDKGPAISQHEYRNLQKRPGETHKQHKARVKAFLSNPQNR